MTQPPAPPPDVVAAGAVVFDGDGNVLLVHRPAYDDWAWPKGKQDRGEHIAVTAVREVLEETGVEIRLGRPLPPQAYRLQSGRTKVVDYWIGHVIGDEDVSGFVPNDEIDAVRWVSLDRARSLLTYASDRQLLTQSVEISQPTSSIVVLRHAEATKRAVWAGSEADRPLTDDGTRQAAALVPVLAAYGVTRVISSDWRRCVDTVLPYADEMVVPVELVPALNEEKNRPGPVVEELLDELESTVLCTHRPVLTGVFDHLGVPNPTLAPAQFVVCHHHHGELLATEQPVPPA